ncbi:ABC transporter substrate-binding protein [Oryzicola mucosus]|uniref:ABC transporter substrate-binding protein n=1 Tax=Oryzicola mucosus TaxID=2767425 RepID=A0A8J6U610_9HYPH|nr:ABC transporter substrate-binding protein [Oryzicola mucosus]MBD0417385.1 ABC transporter substrate-binding protein [Oryzicola mucosus]
MRDFTMTSAAVLTAILLTAPASAQSAPRLGGTAIIGLGAEPQGFNSALTSATPDALSGCMIYEGLVTTANDNGVETIQPLLAKSWEVSGDGLTYTFHLRQATWQDGEPFTSEDVRYTLEEVVSKFSPIFSTQVGSNLLAVDTPDKHTAVIRLKEPYAPLLKTLNCTYSAPILPAHLFKGTDVKTNLATNQQPVGTGPFRFVGWERGSHITLVRNETYWEEGKPYLDGLIIRSLPNAASRIQALISGEIDFIPMVYFPLNDAKLIENNPDLKVTKSGFAPNMTYMSFNLEREPMSDVRVRDALLRASDRQFIHDNAFSGYGEPGRAPWPTEIVWAANPDVNYDQSHPFDLQRAAQLLDEAGYEAGPDGTRFGVKIIYSGTIPERHLAALALKANWREIGVDVALEPLDLAVVMPRVFVDRDFDIYLNDFSSYGDPAIGIARAFITDAIGRVSGNAPGYSNPEVDQLFTDGAKATSEEERARIYRSITPILMRDLPLVMLHELSGFDGSSQKLHGLWGWMGNGRWGNAWVDE